ncbi:hypothetical protein Ae201684P_017127 [Aphanomyces euteiches]|nr:hypothetical protein Ae201684P_017127 [Aphanomyces euteiches]
MACAGDMVGFVTAPSMAARIVSKPGGYVGDTGEESLVKPSTVPKQRCVSDTAGLTEEVNAAKWMDAHGQHTNETTTSVICIQLFLNRPKLSCVDLEFSCVN